jgi:hypothetical protein
MCKATQICSVLLTAILVMTGHVAHAQTELQQNQLLNSNGVSQNTARQQLIDLQQQIQLQSQSVTDPSQLLKMAQQRMDILHTLAIDATLNIQPQEMARWQQALRAEAWQLRHSDNPQMKLLGEYWHLLCELADMNRLSRDLESSQRACITKMQQFLQTHSQGEGPVHPSSLHLIQQVRLALLQIYDQRGMSVEVCQLLKQTRQQDPENQQLNALLQQQYGYCHLIGQKFNAKLTTIDGKTWDSRDKLGKPILIYFWPGVRLPGATSDKSTPQDPLWQLIRSSSITVLLVNSSYADESGLQIPAFPWDCYRTEPGQFDPATHFNIQTLPRVVLIDKKGIIKSVGGPSISGVLERLLAEK